MLQFVKNPKIMISLDDLGKKIVKLLMILAFKYTHDLRLELKLSVLLYIAPVHVGGKGGFCPAKNTGKTNSSIESDTTKHTVQ